MPIDRIVDSATHVPEGRKDTLRAVLKAPEDLEYRMYGDVSVNGAPSSLVQGDIFDGVEVRLTPQAEPTQSMVMVLSNTCDLHPKEGQYKSPCATVAPVQDMAAYRDAYRAENGGSLAGWDEHHAAIRNGLTTNLLWLPEHKDFNESVIVFNYATPIVTKQLGAGGTERLASLSDIGYYYTLMKLALHFVRVESEEVGREEVA